MAARATYHEIVEQERTARFHRTLHEIPTEDGMKLIMTHKDPGRKKSLAPVILVHGLGQNRYSWTLSRRSMESFLVSEGFETFNVELRGHGLSRANGCEVPKHFETYLFYDMPAVFRTIREITGGKLRLDLVSLPGAQRELRLERLVARQRDREPVGAGFQPHATKSVEPIDVADEIFVNENRGVLGLDQDTHFCRLGFVRISQILLLEHGDPIADFLARVDNDRLTEVLITDELENKFMLSRHEHELAPTAQILDVADVLAVYPNTSKILQSACRNDLDLTKHRIRGLGTYRHAQHNACEKDSLHAHRSSPFISKT